MNLFSVRKSPFQKPGGLSGRANSLMAVTARERVRDRVDLGTVVFAIHRAGIYRPLKQFGGLSWT